MTVRNFIDYAQQADGVNSREALYSAIHDRVTAHIEAKKQEIAQGLVAQTESAEAKKSPFPGSDEYKAKYPESKFEKEPSKSEKGGTVYRRKEVKESDEKPTHDVYFTHHTLAKSRGFSVSAKDEHDAVKKATALLKKAEPHHHKNMSLHDVEDLRQHESVNEAREDSPIKGTVKKATYEDGKHKVEVRYNNEYDEYSAHPYKEGKHMGEGPVSYHGNDKEDAHDTAKSMLKHLNSKKD